MKPILLVEDDKSFGYILSEYLMMDDFKVEWVKSGEEALELMDKNDFSLALFDIMLPGISGFDLAQKVRARNVDIPFIFISAKSLKVDQLRGFKLGAFDYITKPIDEELLIAKIKSLLALTERKELTVSQPEKYQIGNYLFFPSEQLLKIGDTQIRLTSRESGLLELLVLQKNQLLQRKSALKQLWGSNDEFNRKSMDVFISHLRRHLSKDPKINIQNVHGKGFILICE